MYQFYQISTLCTRTKLNVTAKIAICRSCNVLHSLNTKYHSLCQSFNVLYLLNTRYCSPCHSSNVLHLLNPRYCLLCESPNVLHVLNTYTLFSPSLIMCYAYWTPDTLPTVSLITRVTLDEDILFSLSDVLYSLNTVYCSLCHSCDVLHLMNTIYSFLHQSCNFLHSIHCVMFLLQDVSHHGNPFLYIQNTKVCARTWVNINF
jgi:hypothetical protein